ncbi:MAG: glycosyltransferase [Chloroflexi bacterium]|nr:glycosyltransferase [Chloroflexota bacterium]
MRILYALNLYRPSIDGVSISIERQAAGLANRGHVVAIIAPGESLADYEEKRDGIHVYRLRAVRLLANQWRLALMPGRAVDRVLDEFRPDVVVVSVPFLLNRSVWLGAREHGCPVVGITGLMPEWFIYNLSLLRPLANVVNGGLWRLITDYYNQCDHVVGVTETALHFLRAHRLTRPCTVISNGVQLDRFSPRPYDVRLAARLGLPDRPTVLYAGRLDAEKRLDVWLRAAAEVVRQVDAHFVIAGDGTERLALCSLAQQLGIPDRVTFPGFFDEAGYPRVFSLADVFAIASPAELQSIVTLEAAASGLPLVAARAGALPELVHHGQNGYLFEPGNSDAMAEAIVALLRDPDRRKRMGAESRAIAHTHDIRQTFDRYEDVYRQVLRARVAA